MGSRAAQPAPAAGYGTTGVALDQSGGKKKKGMGMAGGLAVGAAAGVLGGLALAGGASYVEHKIEDRVTERVEEDMSPPAEVLHQAQAKIDDTSSCTSSMMLVLACSSECSVRQPGGASCSSARRPGGHALPVVVPA
ncbi:hypothetical protein TRIUR3_23174 [Triticum urartu]|uniref:Uncharacterized protein n=1 Tax=Triticum urartu TaxID=4572 RepID=M7Z3B0_TRIUA|nr:hypothetical protein TRIUR3_23174 [Triticum urartu]